MKKTISPKYKKFYENPNRSIHVDGKIDGELFKKLSQEIIQLRSASSEPITVYLNSDGGQIRYSRMLMNLLKSPKQNGESCPVITVVHSFSASAASIMLDTGDYAIAYPKALIQYHGASTPNQEEITREEAESISEFLAKENEELSEQLAYKAFARVMTLMHNVFRIHHSEFEKLTLYMQDILSPNNQKIIAKSLKTVKLINEVEEKLVDKLETKKPKDGFDNLRYILDAIIDITFNTAKRQLSKKKNEQLTMDGGGLSQIVNTYEIIADYNFGRYRPFIESAIKSQGFLFLTNEEKAELKSITDKEQHEEKLLKYTEPKVRQLAHFIITYCRLLQQGEYEFTANEAFSLGFVDEVVDQHFPIRAASKGTAVVGVAEKEWRKPQPMEIKPRKAKGAK